MEVNPDTEALPISTGVVGTMLLTGAVATSAVVGTRNWGKSRLVEEVFVFRRFRVRQLH